MPICEGCRRDADRLYRIEITGSIITCSNDVCLEPRPIKNVITNLCLHCYLAIIENPDGLSGELTLLDCSTL